MRSLAIAALCGALFALGLLVSGMTVPANVTGFLDVSHGLGHWNPALAFVMAGAIAVHAPLVRLVRRRRAPLYDASFHWPSSAAIDPRLIVGAALFGIGWGLSGFCPGPALVSLGAGATPVVVFVLAMLGGVGVTRLALRALRS